MEFFNKEAEQAVLGSVLIDQELIKDCRNKPQEFSAGKHQELFKVYLEMDAAGRTIDPISIADWLQQKGDHLETVGGLGYVMELSGAFPTTANFQTYSQIVTEHFKVRESAFIGNRLAQGMSTDEAISQLEMIRDFGERKKRRSLKEGLVSMYNRIESADGKMTGIPSGYRDVDNLTLGWQDQDLVIVAARPSVGKTAYALNMAINAAASADNLDGAVVAIFSLEMPLENLLTRMAAMVGNIDSQKLRIGRTAMEDSDWRKLTYSMGNLSNSDIVIIDDPVQDLGFISRECRELRKQYKDRPLLILIDYLQLIQGDPKFKGNRQQEISDISRGLKQIARSIKAPVIALSQLSRGVEQRQDKRPMMSDLRESGQIEQDADVIQFLYREDYYDKETEDANMIEIITAKQRNGPTGTSKLAFVKEYGKFVTIDWSSREA